MSRGGGRAGLRDRAAERAALSCLRVHGGGHVAQAAVEAAHLEEDALLWAGGELAAGGALEVLGQPEAWSQDNPMVVTLVKDHQ